MEMVVIPGNGGRKEAAGLGEGQDWGEGAGNNAVFTLKRGGRDMNEHEYALKQIYLNVSIY